MDIIESEIVYSDKFYSMHVPEIKKVIGTNGTEREVDEQCIRDVNSLVRKMVVDYKCTPIDLNDMLAVLQAGNSAIVVAAESSGLDRAERAVSMLVERFKLAGCPLEQAKELILHIQFTAEDYRPTLEEHIAIEEALFQHVAKNNSLLMGFTDDGSGDEDALTVTAIAIC